MSDLPAGWEWTTTRELFTFVTSGSRGWARYYSEEGAPFIRVGNLRRGSITPDLADLQRVNPPDGSEGSRTRVQANDILISITADLGRVALMTDVSHESYINQHVALARPVKTVNAKYLSWYLVSGAVQRQWMKQQRGVTKLGLGLDDIRSIAVPLPPRAEQDEIVVAIEEQFSRLDAGMGALRSAQRRSMQMGGAVLEAAIKGCLTGGLGTWRRVRLDEIADVSGGITKNPKRAPRDNSFPFLRVANVMRNRLDLTEIHQIELFSGDLERYSLKRGDLLIVEGNGSPEQIGRSALWDGSIDPCVHQNHLIRARPREGVVPEYLNVFWNAPSTMARIQAAASSTSGLHTLSTGKVRRIEVALPPLKEQQLVVEEVERRLSAINDVDRTLNVVNARSRALRTSILDAAFSGKLI